MLCGKQVLRQSFAETRQSGYRTHLSNVYNTYHFELKYLIIKVN